jgi:cytoplasmic iron level regulating protein YaaA (DUF328/UPF0246 family)
MLSLLSPAKTIKFEYPLTDYESSQPYFIDDVNRLVRILKKLSVEELRSLMSISEPIAIENRKRYREWKKEFTEENAHPALFAFQGGVYQGLNALDFDQADLTFAQDHLRILSGLYGVLRPFDLMQAYRLEMGTRLANKKGSNLYHYWGDTITKFLNKELDFLNTNTIVNLASDEYFKAVNTKKLKAKVINYTFKENRDGQLKFISFNAKKARGQMVHFITKNKLTKVEDTRGFDYDGYVFKEELSSDDNYCFIKEA